MNEPCGDFGMSITYMGGSRDGLQFKQIQIEIGGQKQTAWICNELPGYFKQVFVPLDFEHEKIIK